MKKQANSQYRKTHSKKRPGIHAKSGTSRNKRSKNYKKMSRGQG